MSCDYESEQSYSIKLMKTIFSSSRDIMRPTMLPQLDINFHFICKSNLSEWVIKHDDDHQEEPTLTLVRQSRHGPSIKNVVRRSLMQFLFYIQTREAIDRVLEQLLPNSADNQKRRDMIEYAIEKASEIVKTKPTDRNVLDLFFSVLVQHDRVISDLSDADSY